MSAPMRFQPQGLIRLNRSNPLTRGLVAAYIPRSGPRDATGALATLVDVAPVASSLGYMTPPLNGGPCPVVGTFPFVRTDPISAFVLGRFAVSNDAFTAPVISVGQVGGTNGWKFGPLGTGGNLDLTFASIADYATTVPFPAIGSIAFSAIPGSNARIFTNGGFRQQIAVGTPNASLATARMAVGQRGDAAGDSTSASQVALALYWNRALSDAEQASLAANPWQLFNAGSSSSAYQAAIASGTSAPTAISAAIAWAEGSDTGALAAVVTDTGALAWTEAGDTASIAGLLTNRIAAVWSEADDAATLGAVITNRAASAWTEGDDSAAAAGVVTDRGALTWTEQGDSVSLTGSAASPAPAGFTATLSWTEAGDSASIVARLISQAALAITEQGDTWALTAYAAQPAAIRITVRFDVLPRNFNLKTIHFSN